MIESQTELELIESGIGRFLIEMQSSKEDIFLLIEASTVSPEIKLIYTGIIKNLIEDLEKEVSANNETPTVNFSRYYIIKLLDTTNKKDPEQYHLFETTRNAILRAENSALGWSSENLTK